MLFSEMKIPGDVWLEFDILQKEQKRFEQKAEACAIGTNHFVPWWHVHVNFFTRWKIKKHL